MFALFSSCHAHLRVEFERFGGTVEKFIGDAVMALSGAPVAHKDDRERAVGAALAIRDWAREQGEELHVRIAVNTGEALVMLDARPAEGEAIVAGDVVHTAARLQTAAPLNGVLVGEQAYRGTARGQSRSPRRSRTVSEELGWDEGLSEALNLRGMERVWGDRGGLEDLERSIELARMGAALRVLDRSQNSLAVEQQVLGKPELGYQAQRTISLDR